MRDPQFYARVKAMEILNEGSRRYPYRDTKGKVTIGIGHNLTDRGITPAIEEAIFKEDYLEVVDDLARYAWWMGLDDVRAMAVFDIRFNLGATKFAAFTSTLGYVKDGDFLNAARSFRRNRRYAEDIGARFERIATMLETGLLA